MEKSTSIANIAKALCDFQSELKTLPLDRTVKVKIKSGGEYSFKYATFSAIVEYIRPLLAKNKLTYSQLVETDASVTTLLMHESGEYLISNLLIKGEQTPQGIGSGITYAKRYALSSMLGIVSDDDDDANIAQGNTYTTGKNKQDGVPAEIMQQWIDVLKSCKTLEDVTTLYKQNEPMLKQNPTIKALFTKRKEEINGNH